MKKFKIENIKIINGYNDKPMNFKPLLDAYDKFGRIRSNKSSSSSNSDNIDS